MSVTLVPSDLAPAEAVHYTFSTVEFDLGGRTKKYETEDPAVVSEAHTHPWLDVKETVVEEPAVEEPAPDTELVAIESGLAQTVVVKTEEVAETVAADSSSKTSKKKD